MKHRVKETAYANGVSTYIVQYKGMLGWYRYDFSPEYPSLKQAKEEIARITKVATIVHT